MALLLDRFSRVLRDDPDSPLVLSFAGRSWSAADLDEWAFGLVARCEALRVPAGSPIVTALGNRPEFIAVILAGLRSGRPILPADPGTTAAGILALARSFGAPLLVTRRSFMTGESTALPGGTRLSIAAGVEPQVCSDVGVMKLTSGSTGVPKAVLASPDNMAHDVEQIVSAMGIRDDDVQLGTIPLSHAYGLGNLVLPVLWQGTRVALREGFVPQRLHEDVRACGIRVWPAVPFMFEHLLAQPGPSLPSSLGLLISAGAPLSGQVLEQFHARFDRKIHSFYGTSETGGIAFDGSDVVDGARGVGHPLPHARVSLSPVAGLDEHTAGRVHVAGPAVSPGYSAGTDASDFCAGGFLTGDLGRFEEDGRLVLTGRLSAFVNVAGRKVHPEEVAVHLRDMPGVRDVRVMGVPSDSRGEQLVAIIVPAAAAPTLLQLRQFCSARLPPHKIPRLLVITSAIPIDGRGKTDRRQLEALVRNEIGGSLPGS
jgi:acyl-CoA synthetase (AMP-forming)/AMP-acid ligase II